MKGPAFDRRAAGNRTVTATPVRNFPCHQRL